MAVQSRLSLLNYMQATLSSLSATSAQTNWPATNARYPHQPFVPWKTADGSTSGNVNIQMDFATAQPIDFVLGVNLNYTNVEILLDSDPGFSPADFNSGTITATRNPWNRRYTLAYVFSSQQTKRYMIWQIKAGTPVDGANYFSTGGLWVGVFNTLPSDLRWDEVPEILEPRIDTPLLSGGTQRVSIGRPLVRMAARRIADVAVSTPATGDQLGSWLDIDRQWAEAGHAAWYFNRGNTSEAFIFRKINESAWPVNQTLSEDDLICEEVVGP